MSTDTSVREDPDLTPEEKETTLRFAKDESMVHVHTEESGWVNRLLHHDHFEEKSRRMSGDHVVAVTGELPMGCLSVKADPRQTDSHAEAVSGGVFND